MIIRCSQTKSRKQKANEKLSEEYILLGPTIYGSKSITQQLKWSSRELQWYGCASWAYGKEENPKISKRRQYHHIKCIAATFLAAFIWRRPLNSATLATATHRELESVSDGTSTQVEVQMINKWRVKMIQKRIYKVKDSSWKGDRKKQREKGL